LFYLFCRDYDSELAEEENYDFEHMKDRPEPGMEF